MTDSLWPLALAEGTERDHAIVIRLVRDNISDLKEFGLVGFEIRPREASKGSFGIREASKALGLAQKDFTQWPVMLQKLQKSNMSKVTC